jgi:hypothetical protein
MWAEGGVTTEGEEVGAAEVEALVFEEAAMASMVASVLPSAVSAVAEVAESVAMVGGGSVMFTSLAAADGEV